MKMILTICYLVFLGFITVTGASGDLQYGYPLWMTVSGLAIPAVGAVSMILYMVSYKPKYCSWIWKITPFVLLGFYAVSWYFDFVLYRAPDDSPELIGVATFLGILLFFPLLYSSFKFGYSMSDI